MHISNVSPECLSDNDSSLTHPSNPPFGADWENEVIKTVKNQFLIELDPNLSSEMQFVKKTNFPTSNYTENEFTRGKNTYFEAKFLNSWYYSSVFTLAIGILVVGETSKS